MAPKYVLTDFEDGRAAEPIRYLLSYGQFEFTDKRVKREDFLADKPNIAIAQLPTLEVDGKTLHKGLAICRYLGRELGIAGADNWEAAQIDAVAESILDLGIILARVVHTKDPAEKEERREKLRKETMPFIIQRLEKRLTENGGHVVGGKLTWADLVVTGVIDLIEESVPEDKRKDLPNTLGLHKKVHELPGVKEWVQKRPAKPRSLAELLN